MRQHTAPTSLTIRIITAVYGLLTLGMLAAGLKHWPMFLVGGGLAVVGLFCYLLWAPVAFGLDGDTLTVFFRLRKKQFAGVTRCERIVEPLSPWTTIRVCGNGGLFAGSGLFYNRRYGYFHAYVTSEHPAALVLVQTSRSKIIISPQDPERFMEANALANAGAST